ncbi:hypothetical protein H634G_02314 [Metarhizium anisopliae BRIP 53293]|uniref:Uncharacterized protein n=1 Tax=Metarhizium anisopliae BRIP 53293 TaxID=1291518 RepID=A0A0D9P7R4_METAN|nr:hypothetical protein H634G_02314 [Metarhizium anisopliae BRIP 53293]KJK95708.1 hypothetical protein H633G_00396 [Metarhizium anisopliae BRIP 53284]
MIPSVDDQVLRDNPEFAKLYSVLKNDILNPDGSTKCDPDVKERKVVNQRAIATASPPDVKTSADKPADTRSDDPTLTEPSGLLAELLLILPSLVDSDLPVDSHDVAFILSSPPFSEFESLLPELGAIISANLHASALSLVRITHPSKNPSYLHRHIPSLPADHAALRGKLSEAQQSLISNRLQALASLTELISSYTQSLKLLIQALESKHGLAARSLELRALDVSLEAQSTELDAKATSTSLSKEMYSPEAVTALRHYLSHLKDAQVRAAERVRGLQAELGEYGVGVDKDGSKEKTMKEMARVYHEMERQMEDVKKDLDRLDNKQDEMGRT